MTSLSPKDILTQYLRNQSGRLTPERFEVLDAVLDAKGHFDADQLYLRMKVQGSKVSRATVYNTLDILTECGITARYRFGEKLARYEAVIGAEHHHHMICRSCGVIEEFVDKRVDRMARDAARSLDYELESCVMHVYGLCPTCADRRNLTEVPASVPSKKRSSRRSA